MTSHRLKWFATLIASGALLAAASPAAPQESVDLPIVDAPSERAQALAQAAVRAAQTGRLEASGTWRTADGKRSGTWRLADRLQLTKHGKWAGAILVDQDDAADTPGAVPSKPVRVNAKRLDLTRARRVEIEGTVVGNRMEISVPRGSRAVAAAAQEAPAFAGSATATVSGVKIDGTFSNLDGTTGQWDGWWQVWE